MVKKIVLIVGVILIVVAIILAAKYSTIIGGAIKTVKSSTENSVSSVTKSDLDKLEASLKSYADKKASEMKTYTDSAIATHSAATTTTASQQTQTQTTTNSKLSCNIVFADATRKTADDLCQAAGKTCIASILHKNIEIHNGSDCSSNNFEIKRETDVALCSLYTQRSTECSNLGETSEKTYQTDSALCCKIV